MNPQAPTDVTFLKSFLSEQEQAELQKIVANPALLEAVKKVVLAGVYYNGTLEDDKKADPMRNWAMTISLNGTNLTDEEIGQILRAKRYGVELIEDGFRAIEAFQKVDEDKGKEKNPAR